MGFKRYIAGVSMSKRTDDAYSQSAATNLDAGVSLSNETNAAVSKETGDTYSELAATNGTGV